MAVSIWEISSLSSLVFNGRFLSGGAPPYRPAHCYWVGETSLIDRTAIDLIRRGRRGYEQGMGR